MQDSAKWELRRRVVAARRAVPEAVRAAEAAALAAIALPVDQPATVCAYWPVGAEPGSPELLDALVRRGCRVLLPLVTHRGPLDWADYTGASALRPGPLGLREPTGPPLGAAVIATAALVLVLDACADTTKSSEVVKADVVAHHDTLGAALTAQQQNNFWR